MALTYPTLAELVAVTELRIGQVSGIGAQVYAEDVIAEMLIHKFDVLFDKFHFPEYTDWYAGTLGSDGKCNTALNDSSIGLNRFKDIIGVWYEDDKHPLKRFTSRRNANNYAVAGNRPRYIEATADTKIFRCLGLGTSGDNVDIYFKKYPDEIVADTTIKIDKQALVLGAAFDYLADDDANAGATEKMRTLFNQRIEQLTASFSNLEVEDPRAGGSHVSEDSGYQVIG